MEQCKIFSILITLTIFQRWVECEADCTLSLSLDSGYVKSYFRRAMARVQMGKISSAQKGTMFPTSNKYFIVYRIFNAIVFLR